jgi:hypothetical protein
MIVAHDFGLVYFISTMKFGLHKSKAFGSHGVMLCRKDAHPPWGVHPMPDPVNSSRANAVG